MKAAEYKAEDFEVAKLKPHPAQAQHFGPPEEVEIESLKESMRKGLDNPLHVLPDGTILGGHRRTAAAKKLGWKTIPCIIRHDLVGDEVGQLALLIRDNVERRQLNPVAFARNLKALLDLEQASSSPKQREGRLRDRIGVLVGVVGRQVDRYLALLKLPAPILDAIEGDWLVMADGAKLLADKEACEKVRGLMAGGMTPREAMQEAVGTKVADPAADYATVMKCVKRINEIGPLPAKELEPNELSVFRMAHSILDKLIKPAAHRQA